MKKNRKKEVGMKNTHTGMVFDPMACIRTLSQFGTRQGVTARRALKYLCRMLEVRGVPFHVESFDTFIPVTQKASLVVDGKNEPCIGCGMTSGRIPRSNIASSLLSSRFLIDTPVIYVNPQCPVPSPTNFSFAPAIGVAPETAKLILNATSVRAELRVSKQKVAANFLLVGNRVAPKTIVFSHYDSLGPGAFDNASGTAIALAAALRCFDEGTLADTLFVFDGNEEVSYDYPTYWGHGYRVFEKRYSKALARAQQVLVVDCVGNGRAHFIQDERILKLAFPLANIGTIQGKTFLLSGDFDDLMTVYHSAEDTPKRVSISFLRQAQETLFRRVITVE